MLNVEKRFRPNEEQVAAKIMDGEAILINLSNGMYYSMGGIGGFVWALIESRQSLSEVADAVADRFGIDSERALSDVQALTADLLAENLVVECDTDVMSQDATPDGADLPDDYTAPQLQKFDDMADMFALDPPLPGLTDVTVNAVPERSED